MSSMAKVAKVAGVSISTVSRVVNRKLSVSDDTLRRVKKAIDDTEYVPQTPQKRKGPKQARSSTCAYGTVAVLFPAEEVPFACNQAVRVFATIGAVLRQRHYHADFLVIEDSPSGSKQSGFDEKIYSGVIILGYNRVINLIEKDLSVPCVVLSSNTTNSRSDRVLAGNFEIGQIAADYLVSRKRCKSVAFLNCNPTHSGLKARGKGFIFHAEELGASTRWVDIADNSEAPVVPENFLQLERLADLIVKEFLRFADSVDGVFIPLDRYTAFIYPRLIKNGLIPNKNIFVISSDNEPSWLAGLSPRPATIDVNIDLISKQAAERLFQRISNEDDSPAMQISFEPVLIEGEDFINE